MNRLETSEVDIVGCEDAGTIPGLLHCRVARSPEAVAYAEFDQGNWRDVTWREMSRRVDHFRAALDQAGLCRGDRVAILLPNCTDWIAFDIAAMANGLITVPLYLHDSAANIRFILSHSGARLCLMDTSEHWSALASELANCTSLSQVWLRKGDSVSGSVGEVHLKTLAEALAGAGINPGPMRCAAEDIATLIHTSGTTGRPKGAMLSHHALLRNAEGVTEFIPPLTSDVFLSLLPLAHAFERCMSYHLAMMGGAKVVFARSIGTLRQDIETVRPTVLVAVPRLYERLYEAILRKAAGNPVKRYLANLAARTGWRRFEARHGRARPLNPVVRLFVWPMLERMVSRPVLHAFGGRMRVAVSGGAPLSTGVSHFLIGLGLPLVEGYGLTEASPVITATTMEDNWPGSVGRPLRGIEFRITDGGELLVKSPSLMKGYWQDPETSGEAIDSAGWLHTGDVAECRDGRLFITGRLKDLIVLSTGKNVASAEVEAAIEVDPLFEQCCVIGNNRALLVALLVLDRDEWKAFAVRKGLEIDKPNTPAAKKAIREHVARATRCLPSFSHIRAFHALLTPWTVADGSLTPTLKIRRHVIEARYRTEIESLYAKPG